MRKQILDAVQEKVDIYNEEILRLTNEITICQKELDSCMETADVPVEVLLIVKQEMEGAKDADKRIKEIDQEIETLSGQLEVKVAISEDIEKKPKKLLDNIIVEMNDFYIQVDTAEDSPYGDIFTAQDKFYSGSEATEFHLAKMYAFAKSLQHDYPIIVVSFRAEDLSSDREARVINLFDKLNNQIIFTTTLKAEEGEKYAKRNELNNISFSAHTTNKMLSVTYVEKFIQEVEEMMVTIKGN